MSLQVHKLSDTLYQFNEAADFAGNGNPQPYVDAYLLIGAKRAALIDCLQNATGLYEAVRNVTSLPVDLLITHGHGDHAGVSTREFAEAGCSIYMAPIDFDILSARSPEIKREWFTDLKEGDCFDLGGYKLETIACGGHTPGSVVFLEREHQMLFSGDTVGSGHFWMQIPSTLPLSQFRENVVRLCEKLEEFDHLLIYPGHRNQSPVQLTGQYVKDTRFLTDGILDGSIVGEDREMEHRFGGHISYKEAAYGQMLSFCYNPKNL